jgi:hypothetical protein
VGSKLNDKYFFKIVICTSFHYNNKLIVYMAKNCGEIKEEALEPSYWRTGFYPLQFVKIEYDSEVFPPVRWFPLPNAQNSGKRYGDFQGNASDKLAELIEAQRAALFGILNATER